MPDFEAPERDAIEPEEASDTVADSLAAGTVDVDLEAPEADAVEQSTPVRTQRPAAEVSERSIEADDADAADQEHVVEFDEDEYR